MKVGCWRCWVRGKCALIAGGDHFVGFWTLRVLGLLGLKIYWICISCGVSCLAPGGSMWLFCGARQWSM